MKTLKYILSRASAIAVLALVFVMSAKAQMTDSGYASINQQFNFPLNNHLADKISGWGMNLEGGYFLTSNFALGGFLSYHSNREYLDRQTLLVGESGSLNTGQQHTVFRLPLGLATCYTWNHGGAFQPHVGVKLGVQYAQLKSAFNAFEANEDAWGFYVFPEIDFNIYPWAYGPGLHFAIYYSYGINKGDLFTYGIDGMNSVGPRIGIAS